MTNDNSKPESVLFLAGRLGPGGVSTHMATLAHELKSRGIRVAIASNGDFGNHSHGVAYFEEMGIQHFEIPFPLNLNTVGFSQALRKFRSCTLQFRPSILHVHWRSTSLFAKLAQIIHRIPFVSTLHISGTPASFKHRLITYWGNYSIAVSSETEHDLLHRFRVTPSRVLKVPYGVDNTYFRAPTPKEREAARHHLEVPSEAFVVSHIGSGFKRKGHQFLLHALGILRDRSKNCLLVIAGDPVDQRPVFDLAKALGISDCVRHLGYQDSRQLLWASDVFVLPSEREGLPIVINEAMHCGIPHIRTPTAGNLEQTIDGKTGLLIPFADPAALASKLEQILNDRKLASELAAASMQLARKEFCADIMADRVLSVYRSALRRSN